MKKEAPARKRVSCLRARGEVKSWARVLVEVDILGGGGDEGVLLEGEGMDSEDLNERNWRHDFAGFGLIEIF